MPKYQKAKNQRSHNTSDDAQVEEISKKSPKGREGGKNHEI